MATLFPGSTDAFVNPTSSTLMDAAGGLQHDVQHTNINDAVAAIQQCLLGFLGMGTAGLTVRNASTQDGVRLQGRNGGTTSLAAIITIAGALTGSFNYALPVLAANDTFAMLGQAQTFSVAQTISDTTSAVSSITGALKIGNGTAATNVGIGGGNVNAGGTLTVGGATSLGGALTVTRSTAVDLSVLLSNTSTTNGSFFHALCGNGTTSVRYAALIITSSETAQQQWQLGFNGSTALLLRDNTNSYSPLAITAGASTAAVMSFNCSLDATAFGTAGNVFAGGVSIAKTLYAGSIIAISNRTTAGVGQIIASDQSNTNKTLRIGFDGTSNVGWLQAGEVSVANRPLNLNPNGGGVNLGAAGVTNTLLGICTFSDATSSALTVAGGAILSLPDETTAALRTNCIRTIAAGVTDGYLGGISLSPTYNGAFTVTRHNYWNLTNAAGTSTITDAAVMRFDAAIGTHKALAAGTTKTTPGAVTGWLKVNVNGTLHFSPLYSSQTS